MALGQDILESILYGTTNVEPIRVMREKRRALEVERMQAEAQAQALSNFQRQLAGEAVRGERGNARQEYLAAQETAKQKKREMEVWTGIMDDDRDPGQILSDPETYKRASKAGQGLVDKLMSARDAYTNLTGGSFGSVGGGAFPGELQQSLSALAPRQPQIQGAQTLPASPAEAFRPIARQVPGPLPPAAEAIPARETLGPSPPALGAPQEPMDIQSALGQLDPITRSALLAAGPKGPELLLGMLSERQKEQGIQERLGALGGGAPAGMEETQRTVNPVTGDISIQSRPPAYQIKEVTTEGGGKKYIYMPERPGAPSQVSVEAMPGRPKQIIPTGELTNFVDIKGKSPPEGTTYGDVTRGGKYINMSPAASGEYAELRGAASAVASLVNLGKKIFTSTGPGGRVKQYTERAWNQLTQSNPDMVEYQRQRQALASMMARAQGETGALAQGDVQRGLAGIPDLGDWNTLPDTKDVADRLFNNARDLLVDRMPEPFREEWKTRFGGGERAKESGGDGGAEASRQRAADAIARGAPRDKVLERLERAGISTEGL